MDRARPESHSRAYFGRAARSIILKHECERNWGLFFVIINGFEARVWHLGGSASAASMSSVSTFSLFVGPQNDPPFSLFWWFQPPPGRGRAEVAATIIRAAGWPKGVRLAGPLRRNGIGFSKIRLRFGAGVQPGGPVRWLLPQPPPDRPGRARLVRGREGRIAQIR